MTLGEQWLEAIGHLHPIVLHFPIALAATAALVEVIAWLRRRAAPSPSAFTILWVAALSAPLAAATGWFLAATQGDGTSTLDWHRWTGIASAVGLLGAAVMATALRRGADSAPSARRILQTRLYRVSVLAVAALVGYSGHLGGEMKWGEGFTTRKLFAALGTTLGSTAGPADAAASSTDAKQRPESTAGSGGAPSTDSTPQSGANAVPSAGASAEQILFDPHIHAIFLERCAECHLGGRRKGRLSLHERAVVVRVNEDGLPIVSPGAADTSELMRRVLLPEADESAMPPEGPRLSEVQLDLIRRWIEAGAP